MGCTLGKGIEKDQSTKDIDKLMSQYEEQDKSVLKLLLLGAGDSGKTTIFKQMRILYGEGYSQEKRRGLRPVIYNNLVSGAQAIIAAANQGVAGKPLTGKAKEAGERLMQYKENMVDMNQTIADDVTTLWNDENFQAAWDERGKFQVLDGWEDFAKQVHQYPDWGGPGWIPSIRDTILARARTCGIVEEDFNMDGILFRLIDVGGQRNERRKWIHSFDGVTAVIFVVAMSEYDQNLFEAPDKNRLQEAMEVFEWVINSNYFININIILFLNKSDIFRHKLCERKIPLNISGNFPDAPTDFDFDNGVTWIRESFHTIATKQKRPRDIFTHVTCAMDTGNVQVVFDACKDQIFRQNLESVGLI